MTEVEAALRGINAAASIVRTQRSVVDLRHVLEVDTLARSGSRRVLPPPRAGSPPGRAFARGAEALLSSAHDARVATVSLSSPTCIDEQRLRDWLVRPSVRHTSRPRPHTVSCAQEALLWEPASSPACGDAASPPEILRAKGVLCLADPPRQRILQVVRQLYEITDAAAQLLPDEPGVSRLVLIGRRLNAARLADSLREVGAFRVDSTS